MAAPGSCQTPVEVQASQLRQLQTEFMVAALRCQHHPENLPAKYNTFVKKFGGSLSENARVLREHFTRNYGKDQSRRFDSYITTLANEASIRSLGIQQFCETAGPLFDQALKVGKPELAAFAADAVRGENALPACATRRADATSK